MQEQTTKRKDSTPAIFFGRQTSSDGFIFAPCLIFPERFYSENLIFEVKIFVIAPSADASDVLLEPYIARNCLSFRGSAPNPAGGLRTPPRPPVLLLRLRPTAEVVVHCLRQWLLGSKWFVKIFRLFGDRPVACVLGEEE